MDNVNIFIELSSEDQRILEENNITIKKILKNENIQGEVTYKCLPLSKKNGARSKELVPVILALSSSIIAISYAISKILNTIQERPRLIKIYENEIIKNSDGQILLDGYGKPQFKPTIKYEYFEPRAKNRKDKFELIFDKYSNFTIKFLSKSKEKE